MTHSDSSLPQKVQNPVRLLVLIFLFAFAFDATAHQLAINPSQPTSDNTITILAFGNWPSGGAPGLQQWSRNGQSIRIDALGILPGIQQPIVPYQLNVDIGRLPRGNYQVDYYVEVLAAPGPPPGAAPIAPPPDASLSFTVLAPTTTETIPTLSTTALALLSCLLALMALMRINQKHIVNRWDS